MKNKLCILIVILLLAFYSIPFTQGKYISSYQQVVLLNNRKPSYIIKFNSNNGIGYMKDMKMIYGTSQKLIPNTFQKTRCTFEGWNYLDQHFNDEEEVTNLTNIDGDIVELTAKWQDYHVYFQAPPDWNQTQINVYLYNDLTLTFNAPWPGLEATLIDEDKRIYTYEVDKDNLNNYTNIIFIDMLDQINYIHQTIDLDFNFDCLGKIFVPKLYSNLNKTRIFVASDWNIPQIYLKKKDNTGYDNLFITNKISGYGYEYIIDFEKYNSFFLKIQNIQTNNINISSNQDLTYYIIGNNRYIAQRFYYDGLWYNFDTWYETEYENWLLNDYLLY